MFAAYIRNNCSFSAVYGRMRLAALSWTPPSCGMKTVHTAVEQSAGGAPVTPVSRSTWASTPQERWCACCTMKRRRTAILRYTKTYNVAVVSCSLTGVFGFDREDKYVFFIWANSADKNAFSYHSSYGNASCQQPHIPMQDSPICVVIPKCSKPWRTLRQPGIDSITWTIRNFLLRWCREMTINNIISV